jgi:hypothetical protein
MKVRKVYKMIWMIYEARCFAVKQVVAGLGLPRTPLTGTYGKTLL